MDTVSVGAPDHYDFTDVSADHAIDVTFGEDPKYTVDASVDVVMNHGLVSPLTQDIYQGDDAVIDLTPDPGYHVAWITDNGSPVAGPYGATYTVQDVTAAHSVVVAFDNNWWITAGAGTGGTIDPVGPVQVLEGNDQSFTITADPHYHIEDVVIDGTTHEGPVPSYTFYGVSADHTIDAYFDADSYEVTASVSGGHGTALPVLQVVDYDDSATINITPDPNYHVASITDNGVPQAVTESYVIDHVTEPHDVLVTFDLDAFTVNASVSGGHGSLNPLTQGVSFDGTATIDLYPATGYHVNTIVDNGSSKPVANPYVINNVRADHTVVVTYAINRYTVAASVTDGHGTALPVNQYANHGTNPQVTITPDPGHHIASVIDNTVPQALTSPYVIMGIVENHTIVVTFAINTYAVTASVSGGHGTVDPDTQQVNYDTTATIDITPDPGYSISEIKDNTIPQTITNPYLITHVTAAHTVVVTFAINTYTVNASVTGGHGTVSPGSQLKNYGETASIDCLPNANYHVATITDNGAPQTPADPYVIDNVAADHTVVVTYALDTFAVDASVTGIGGTVDPPTQDVPLGGTATVTINPDPGYAIATITDNGTPKTVANPYVITNVTAAHTVVVTFSSSPSVTSLSSGYAYAGMAITVNGLNFGATRGTSYVRFGTFTPAAGDYSAWSDTAVTVNVPLSAYGEADVVLHTDVGGDSNSSAFYIFPYITTCSPTWGNAGITYVTLTGTGFGPTRGTNSVWFDYSKASTYSSWSNTSIRVQIGAGASGQSHVKVMVMGCYSNAKAFDVRSVINSITPTSGPSGTTVTISGSAFCNAKGSGCVYFGSTAAVTYTSWKQSQIKVKVPYGISGTVSVKVYTSGGMSNSKSFKKT